MLKHASNASSAAVAAAVPVNGQLLRTATTTISTTTNIAANANSNVNGSANTTTTNNSSGNNNNSNNNNISITSTNHNGSNGSGNNTPCVGTTAVAVTPTVNSGSVSSAKGTSPIPTPAAAAAAAAVATTARNIHLRPPQPQPLNISALNASNCSTLYNGGGRMAASTLLNIATTTTTGTTPSTTPLKPLLTPLTPLTPNGHCNNGNGNGSIHHHTYTNQHILASSQQQQHQQSLHQHQHQQQHHHQQHQQQQQHHFHQQQQQSFPHNFSNCNNLTANPPLIQKVQKHGPSPREALNSLGLLCLVSLLLALLSLIFLLKISPNSREDAFATIRTTTISNEDFIIVYDVTLALCALSLSLNLCCLLVCAIQFLFAVKLRSPLFDGRENKYLEKSSASRTCAVGGFFISIPVFLTGIILYTFNHFHSTPAIITSILIGLGIVFCGGAMVHNVFVWQKEKTMSYRNGVGGGPPPLVVPLNMSLLSAGQLPLAPSVQFQVPSPPPPVMPVATTSSMPLHGPPAASIQQLYPGQAISVTPVSPNHSHGSFNPLLCLGNNLNGGTINSSFLVRTATATPPTPKPSGSISPGIPPTLDMSNITNISLHELSTLV